MVIPPRLKPGRITNFLKPYVLRMHLSNKNASAQVVHTPTASVAFSASSQEKALFVVNVGKYSGFCCCCCQNRQHLGETADAQ
ncbi:hypothetical protein AG4045_014321 [Apium graveolens]|uniref:Uncharacterized protein n=1 Tax=Apium graveolens TaxID=4045 RepID=A0A6L5BAT3_APIGR|nr:hypothetical protein AG4045_014321 [Apium graveolens]